MGTGQSLYAVEPPNPPGFIHRIEQYVHEGGNFNYRLKYRAEIPPTLQNIINPQLYALFIQKLDEAYQSGPLDADPCCSCDDSDYYRVANNRRDLALQVCSGANQNIFGPHNMRVTPCYRVKKEMAEGREVYRFYQLVDICANVSHTVVVQQTGMAPTVTTGIGPAPAPGTLAMQAQTQHPVAGTLAMGQPNVTMQQPQSPPPAYALAPTYQPQHYQGQYPPQAYQAQPYPAQAQPQPMYQGNGQPMYAQAQPYPTQGQPYPAQAQPYPAQGQPYPAQAQPYPSQSQSPPPPQYQAPLQPGMIQVQPQQPQLTTISTHTLTVLPDPYQSGFTSSGNAQSEPTTLQTQ